jgi:hypothetical protein
VFIPPSVICGITFGMEVAMVKPIREPCVIDFRLADLYLLITPEAALGFSGGFNVARS